MIQSKTFLGNEYMDESGSLFNVTPNLLEQAFEIRTKVFVNEQGVPLELERDEQDLTATHVLVFDENQSVACGRLINTEGNFVIGRIAVLKEKRNQKLGDLVVRVLVRKAFASFGANAVYVHSQIAAEGFYKKLGFERQGENYFEAGIEHVTMIKTTDVSGSCK